MYYIRAEDLGIAFIGPFSTPEMAQAHIIAHFPYYRKVERGYKDEIVEQVGPGYSPISPEDDAAMWARERAEAP